MATIVATEQRNPTGSEPLPTPKAGAFPSFLQTPSGQRLVQGPEEALFLDALYPKAKVRRERSSSDITGMGDLATRAAVALTYLPRSAAESLDRPVSARDQGKENKDSPFTLSSVARPVIPLGAVGKPPGEFFQIVIGNTVLALLGKIDMQLVDYPIAGFTKEGLFTICFKNKNHAQDATLLMRALEKQGCKLGFTSNGGATKLTFNDISEGLAFLSLKCKLSQKQIRHFVTCFEEISKSSGVSETEFATALKTRDIEKMRKLKDTSSAYKVANAFQRLKDKDVLSKHIA